MPQDHDKCARYVLVYEINGGSTSTDQLMGLSGQCYQQDYLECSRISDRTYSMAQLKRCNQAVEARLDAFLSGSLVAAMVAKVEPVTAAVVKGVGQLAGFYGKDVDLSQDIIAKVQRDLIRCAVVVSLRRLATVFQPHLHPTRLPLSLCVTGVHPPNGVTFSNSMVCTLIIHGCWVMGLQCHMQVRKVSISVCPALSQWLHGDGQR